MKKTFSILLVMVLSLGMLLAGCGGSDNAGTNGNGEAPEQESSGNQEEEKVLNVFNWSEYLPQEVIDQFEQETGIKVNYDTYSSNEEMFAKLQAGNAGYDIAVPSLYFVEVMVKEGMLEKINKDNIPNLKNIGDEFLGRDADPNNDYSVPYMWGKDIIAVNKELVDFEVKGYKDLFNPAFENSLVVIDEPRTLLGGMLEMLGYDANSTNEDEIREAGEKLKELLPNIKAFDSDSPKTMLVSNEVKAGVVYGAEAALAMRENPAIEIVYPEEFVSLWQDNLVIPKGAPHKENAEKFINFILRPDISAKISMEYPYGNPNVEALKELPEDIRYSITVPADVVERGKFIKDVGEATVIYDRVWTEVKNSAQ
ncbi:MAG: spermidine/putrescine ABC transporter substrate-binding protein [Bacillaceae bacterium]|nr:spermidine/putrescine ABC transporter substrate-binding protein [Bacillaceae bacterium]